MEEKIISGAIHYFRVVPEYWRDRLEKLKMLGCNTVETYVPWNLHEPEKGVYRFDGMLDIKRFLTIAQETGLQAIVRPAPYICAEWEFGGLPYWLLNEDDMEIRSYNRKFLDLMDRYFDELLPKLAPLQKTNGGPIILMQVENEYGAYGNDKRYMRYMADAMRKRGIDVPLVTSDGTWEDYMQNGSIPDRALPTANFGSKAEEHFQRLRKINPDGPRVSSYRRYRRTLQRSGLYSEAWECESVYVPWGNEFWIYERRKLPGKAGAGCDFLRL